MTTLREAEDAASEHRGRYGDDVIRHDPEDEGDWFACPDCDWGISYVDDGDFYDYDEDDGRWDE